MTERCSAKQGAVASPAASIDASPAPSPPDHLLPAFVAALLALPLDDETRRQVRELLFLHAGERVSIPSARTLAGAQRLAMARSMLSLDEPRSAVRRMLIRSFGVCARQASRDVVAALQLGPFAPAIVRTDGHDATDDTEPTQEPTHHATSV